MKSVSVLLATPDPGKPSTSGPREFWKQRFHPMEEKKEKQGKAKKVRNKRKGTSKSPAPSPAWAKKPAGCAITGALYVLKGDAFLRISVGGEKDESVRIKKAKTLAEEALKRLDSLATLPAGH